VLFSIARERGGREGGEERREGVDKMRRKRGRRGIVNTNGLQPVQCCINRA